MSRCLCLLALLCVACDDGGGAPTPPGPEAPEPEVVEPEATLATQLGLTQYSGAIDPVEEARAEGVITYTFDPAQGPVCMRGAPFRASVREADSDDLVIFLQGGGACWSAFCLAVTSAPIGIPGVDVLDPALADNPVRGWNQVYLPYCDGSFFAGDATHADDLNGKGDRTHRGLAHLTGALEVSKAWGATATTPTWTWCLTSSTCAGSCPRTAPSAAPTAISPA